MLSKETVKKVFPNAPIETIFECFKHYNIEDTVCQASLIAQMAEESGSFTRYIENLNYSAQGLARVWPNRFAKMDKTPNDLALKISRKPQEIANQVYANRLGNGDSLSNDGWKYRGRGAIQLTGKSNYRNIGKFMFKEGFTKSETYLLENPDCLSSVPFAIYSAFAFIVMNNIHKISDFKTMTKRINGGLTGYDHRLAFREKLLR